MPTRTGELILSPVGAQTLYYTNSGKWVASKMPPYKGDKFTG